MKDTTKNINTNTYYFFNKETPELVDEFKRFIIQVNKYLLGLTEDKRYHPSQTRGESAHSKVTFEDKPWRFEGQQYRDGVPLVAEATVSFRGKEVWKMTRSGKFIATRNLTKDKVEHCLQEVAKDYDPALPWRGPARLNDRQTDLSYRALYSGTDKKFFIREAICDMQGVPVWEAICEGGYSV